MHRHIPFGDDPSGITHPPEVVVSIKAGSRVSGGWRSKIAPWWRLVGIAMYW
jgi:hypothetical protein